jgi:hypothetical protein
MRSKAERPPSGAVILVIEIAQRIDQKGWHWDVLLSRAGRDVSTSQRTWDAQGRLSEAAARDLTAWVQQSAWQSLLVWGGIQGELDT